MKLIAYSIGGQTPVIRPAPSSRAWLDKLPDAYGYRCLPLNLGSSHGWEILCPVGCVVMWNGQEGLDSIVVRPDKDIGWSPASHFGSGILTFHTRYLFRTEPGYNLYVTGPTNNRKHGIVPLAAVVETDWSPYTFTMNWMLTEPDLQRLAVNEQLSFGCAGLTAADTVLVAFGWDITYQQSVSRHRSESPKVEQPPYSALIDHSLGCSDRMCPLRTRGDSQVLDSQAPVSSAFRSAMTCAD